MYENNTFAAVRLNNISFFPDQAVTVYAVPVERAVQPRNYRIKRLKNIAARWAVLSFPANN
jgi:hypothetical protein